MEKFKEGTLQANVKLDTVQNSQSTLKIYSSANSLFDIVTNILDISSDNILYPYVKKLLTLIENLFSGNNILIFQLLQSGDFLKLIDQKYIKNINYSITNSNVSLRLELNPLLFDSPNSTTNYDKNFVIDLSFDYIKEETNSYQITLKHLLIDAPVLSKINNFRLELKDTEEKFHEPLESESGSSTSYSVLDNTFEAYDPNKKDEYVNLDDVKKLVQMGINTTAYKYFEIHGILNLSISAPILSIFGDLSKLISPQYVTAKIELMKPNGEDLYSQTRSHITIDKNNYGLFNEDTNYVEYFTERTLEGKEIAYISSIKGSIIPEQSQIVEESKTIFSIERTDNALLLDELKQQYPDYKVSQVQIDKESIYTCKIFENKDKKLQELQKENPSLSLEAGGFFDWNIYKKIFKYTVNTYEKYETIKEHNLMNVETFKVTQDELLKSNNNIPNLFYYLFQYSLINDVPYLLVGKHKKEDVVAILNNLLPSLLNDEESNKNNKIDFISAIGGYTSSENDFSMIVNLNSLTNLSLFKGLKIALGYGTNEDGILTLSNLSISGTGDNNTIIDNLLITATINFDANVFLKKKTTSEFDRYNAFIESFKNSEYTKDLDYHELLGYKAGKYGLIDALYPITNNEKISFEVSSLDTGINAGFIYGL